MHAELAKLLDLQVQDLALADTDARLKAVLDQTGELDGALAGARREIDVARRRVEEGVKRREDLEVRIESYRAIQDRRRSRLESARGVREVQALMVEVEMARSVLAKEEIAPERLRRDLPFLGVLLKKEQDMEAWMSDPRRSRA